LKKPIIYLFVKRGLFPREWKEVLSKEFKLKGFQNLNRFFEAVLFSPPDLILYQYERSIEGFEHLVKEIKIRFNLVKVPLIVLIEEKNLQELENYLAALDEVLFLRMPPQEVLFRIKLVLKKLERISDNNPLTGLPGNVSIEKKLKEALQSERPLAVGYIDLDNFKAYNDLYGFTKGDEIIKNLARILTNTVFSNAKEGFVGHIGGDDFVFIVPFEVAEKVAQEILKSFKILLPGFLSEEDYKRGYFISKDRKGNIRTFPLPSLSIAIVPLFKGRFNHIGEIAERAGEIKKYLKEKGGGAYLIDRRT